MTQGLGPAAADLDLVGGPSNRHQALVFLHTHGGRISSWLGQLPVCCYTLSLGSNPRDFEGSGDGPDPLLERGCNLEAYGVAAVGQLLQRSGCCAGVTSHLAA